MKVVAFNGSPRQKGNTAEIIKIVFEELEKQSITTELVQVGGTLLRGCTSCYGCYKNKTKRCVITDDPVNEWIEKMLSADGIIIGSPVYFYDMTSEMKALIDRAGFVGRSNGRMYKQKVGAAVAVMRRAGAVHALDSMTHFLSSMQMYIVGGTNHVMSDKIGDVIKDDEGVRSMKTLGQNMALLLKMRDAYLSRHHAE